MPRKSKVSPEKKLEAVRLHLDEGVGQTTLSKQFNVHKATIQQWLAAYSKFGVEGLMNHPTNQHYSRETKINAVTEYLTGNISQQDICIKYKIRARYQLHHWVQVYKRDGDFKESIGGAYMKTARPTTPEERLKIVQECLENNKNYGAMAIKYGYSYQQVRSWTLKYEEMGIAGLEDRRGRTPGKLPARTPEEELRDKIRRLEARNKSLEMENEVLKKVKELERRDRFH